MTIPALVDEGGVVTSRQIAVVYHALVGNILLSDAFF
jgi:hypothetical protein